MRSWLALMVLPAFACAPTFGNGVDNDGGGGGGNGDASGMTGGDAEVPSDAAQVCFGTFVLVCFDAADVPKGENTLIGDVFTDDNTLCDQKNSQKDKYCVIAGESITIAPSAKIRAYGSKPLILLSTLTVDMAGVLDVSSTNATVAHPTGPGANASSCRAGTAAAGNSGGFGGSFGGRGGDGEAVNGDQQGIPPASDGAFPQTLRGGCPGGSGAAMPPASGGAGGSGGGAIAIIAQEITLSGTINASGAGGLGGPGVKSGGGGGGSGGMIVIDALVMTGNGVVFANGGGGAQGGAGGGGGAVGTRGGESASAAMSAAGGTSGTDGGFGGAGSFGLAKVAGFNAQGGAGGMGGGGGGGGGAGFVRAPNTNTVTIAPPPL